MALHSALTGSELHEPKGADAAVANKVYVSDGAGSGSWGNLPAASIDSTGTPSSTAVLQANGTYVDIDNANTYYIQATIDDISTASSRFIPCPAAGNITGIISVLQGAITVADGTFRLRIGGVDVTDSTVTIAQSGSAAGDVDTATPTAANTVTANSAIEVQCLGSSTTAAEVEVMIIVTGS
jgi:hypothetical protein